MNLVGTTDTLTVVTSSAAPIDVVIDFTKVTQSGSLAPVPDMTPTAISSATTTTVLAAPGSGFASRVTSGTFRNTSATLSNDLTIGVTRSATFYARHKVTLLPGQTVEWIPG